MGKLVFDRRMQVAAGGMAALTGVGAVVGNADGGVEASGEPVPTPDQAHVRVLTGHPTTVEEGLARHGFRLAENPFAARSSMLEARAQAAKPESEALRVPRKRLKHGMGKKRANEDVRSLQQVLKKLSFYPAKTRANGIYGPKLQRAVKRLQLTLKLMGKPTEMDGNYGPRTARSLDRLFESRQGRRALKKAHAQLRAFNKYSPGVRYAPHSKRAKRLFRAAAVLAGVPQSWAHSRGLHNILASESNGVVGIPNYTYGSRRNHKSEWPKIHNEIKRGLITARSTATGLGQLLNYNVRSYYPAGVKGIGVPVQEAAGMLRYIKARYGTPERAWHLYNTLHEGY